MVVAAFSFTTDPVVKDSDGTCRSPGASCGTTRPTETQKSTMLLELLVTVVAATLAVAVNVLPQGFSTNFAHKFRALVKELGLIDAKPIKNKKTGRWAPSWRDTMIASKCQGPTHGFPCPVTELLTCAVRSLGDPKNRMCPECWQRYTYAQQAPALQIEQPVIHEIGLQPNGLSLQLARVGGKCEYPGGECNELFDIQHKTLGNKGDPSRFCDWHRKVANSLSTPWLACRWHGRIRVLDYVENHQPLHYSTYEVPCDGKVGKVQCCNWTQRTGNSLYNHARYGTPVLCSSCRFFEADIRGINMVFMSQPERLTALESCPDKEAAGQFLASPRLWVQLSDHRHLPDAAMFSCAVTDIWDRKLPGVNYTLRDCVPGQGHRKFTINRDNVKAFKRRFPEFVRFRETKHLSFTLLITRGMRSKLRGFILLGLDYDVYAWYGRTVHKITDEPSLEAARAAGIKLAQCHIPVAPLDYDGADGATVEELRSFAAKAFRDKSGGQHDIREYLEVLEEAEEEEGLQDNGAGAIDSTESDEESSGTDSSDSEDESADDGGSLPALDPDHDDDEPDEEENASLWAAIDGCIEALPQDFFQTPEGLDIHCEYYRLNSGERGPPPAALRRLHHTLTSAVEEFATPSRACPVCFREFDCLDELQAHAEHCGALEDMYDPYSDTWFYGCEEMDLYGDAGASGSGAISSQCVQDEAVPSPAAGAECGDAGAAPGQLADDADATAAEERARKGKGKQLAAAVDVPSAKRQCTQADSDSDDDIVIMERCPACHAWVPERELRPACERCRFV